MKGRRAWPAAWIAVIVGLVLAAAAGARPAGAEAAEQDAQSLWESFFGAPLPALTPEPAPPPPPPPPVLPADIVVENGTLRMTVRADDAAITVQPIGAAAGAGVWQSDPLGPDEEAVNDYWTQRLRSPVGLDYWENERIRTEFADPHEHIAGVTELPDGVRLDYRFDRPGISFSVVYRLGPDYLEITIPAESIKEAKPETPLVSITPLPFFGAARLGDPGYLVLPDGPGVMISFARDLSRRDQRRSVYGEIREELDALGPVLYGRLSLPVYGIVREHDGLLAVLTEGAAEATIGFVSSPEVVFTAANAQFLYRKPYRDLLRRDRVPERFDPYDRQIRYYFLPAAPDGVTYVDLAKRYRRYLMEEKGVRPLSERLGVAPRLEAELGAMQIRLFGGIKKRWERFAPLLVGTTFREAGEILTALIDAGVRKPALTLTGWTRGGMYGALPRKLPPDPTLGGRAGLSALIERASELGVPVGLEDNPLDAVPSSPDFSREDVVKDELELPITRFSLFRRSYLISPARVGRFAERDYPDYAGLGLTGGLTLRYIANGVLPDGDGEHPVTRRESLAAWSELARRAREVFGAVTVRGQAGYLIGSVDRMLDVPVSSDGFWYEDATVPFFEIAVRGLLQYGLEATNLRLDGTYQFLKMVEFGAVPWATLTYRRPTLWRGTPYRELFSSDFRDWTEQLAYEYSLVYERLRPLLFDFIDDHHLLAREVTETRYASGARAIVNYSSTPYTLQLAACERVWAAGTPTGYLATAEAGSSPATLTLPPRGYAVVGP
ncbi:MAG TPA: DUF5696 domain-containing protein [Limnochordia bacterium]